MEPARPLPPETERRAPAPGSFRLVDDAGRAAALEALEARGRLCVTLHVLPEVARGLLGELVEDALERGLALKGDAEEPEPTAPGAEARASSAAASLATRVEARVGRARALGLTGIVLSLGPFARVGAPALDPRDGATLEALAGLALRAPLDVLVDARDADRPAHLAPAPLRTLATDAAQATPATPPPPASAVVLAAPRIVPDAAPEAPAPPVQVLASAPPSGPRGAAAPAAPAAPSAPPEPDAAELRRWLGALTSLEGPQPLGTLERVFVDAYVPLARALDGGFRDARAARAREDFRRGFERAYEVASATFAVTSKRPALVLDAPTRAFKLARLAGARHTVLVLVDGLRFDLGHTLRDAMLTGGRGRLHDVGDEILWSTLPTTTARQLDTLARGKDALADARTDVDDLSLESLRGPRADTLRRVSLGSRDVHKLDTLAAALAARPSLAALDAAATRAGAGLAEAALELPTGTLVYVFGDHGFLLGGRAPREGGSSPDEVLVPAFGALVLHPEGG